MTVTVRLFAVLRDNARTDQMTLDLPTGARVSAAVDLVGERLPAIRPLLPRAACAVNRSYVKSDAILNDGDELALIPPVSGG
jgi:molybdopterin converting factor subunit 1